MWDENKIWHLLMHNDAAVDRAIVAIYNGQTAQEKAHSTVVEDNGIGFSGADVRTGTYYAKWILSGRRLSGNHLEKARVMAVKYRKQLAAIANAKAAEVAAVQAIVEERLAIQDT